MIRSRACLAFLFLLVAALLATGCGSDDGGSDDGGDSGSTSGSSEGKSLFVDNCGSCHTLSDAGTTGSVGPALDDLGLDAERVSSQIASGGGAMPPGIVEGDEADAVAEYVASASGG